MPVNNFELNFPTMSLFNIISENEVKKLIFKTKNSSSILDPIPTFFLNHI